MDQHPGVAPVRRIVTGHDAVGRSVILSDAASPFVMTLAGSDAFGVTDLWQLPAIPADNGPIEEACRRPIVLAPPAGGAVFRLVQFPPDAQYIDRWDAAEGFASLGASGAAARDAGGRHSGMHRTRSVDFAIVLDGEIWALLDAGERLMRAGDVLIQRGTNHAWSNRSAATARVAFVLIDALPIQEEGAGHVRP